MRIGIDATALPPQPVGAGNYIIQLIRSLANVESEFEFVVFAQPEGRRQIDLLESSRIHWWKPSGQSRYTPDMGANAVSSIDPPVEHRPFSLPALYTPIPAFLPFCGHLP